MPKGFFKRLAAAGAAGICVSASLASTIFAAPISVPVLATATTPQVEKVTFWGEPFPYGYVRRDRPLACSVWQRIETPSGPRYRRVPTCGHVVVGRY
jgi:hypothetical protein